MNMTPFANLAGFSARVLGGLVLSGALAAGPLDGTAQAQSVADFYKVKRVTVYIGYGAGGGYDRYGRTLSRHMGRFIPGKPRLIAKNMPGAGSIKLANALYNTLPKDGTAMGIIGRGLPMEPLFGRKGPRYDATKFNWIGSLNNEVSTCVSWHKTGVKTVEDAKKKQLIFATTAQGSDGVDFAIIMNNIVGTKFKLITGYPGGSTLTIAMERGESTGRCGWSWSSIKSTRPDWLRDKKINILVQLALKKHPEISPKVPLVMDLAKTKRDKQILRLIFARQTMGRPFLAPPKLPADRVAALRNAFDTMVKDKGFLKDAKKTKMEIQPVSGKEIEKLIANVYATPKDIVQAAAEATNRLTKTKLEKKVFPWLTVQGKVTGTKRGGRRISFKLTDGSKAKVRVSGSKTKVKVAGKKAKRKAIKKGMSCKIVYKGSGTRAKSLDCK
jgi:tripartite-type tricarboxylate transporter receptor subunit TctC